MSALVGVGAEKKIKGASKCLELSERDAVVAVCVQNDFMDAREADGSYAKQSVAARTIPASATTDNGRTVRRGALAVKDGQEVVGVTNDWLAAGSARGSRLMVTLDRHPEKHCSFCTFGKGGKRTLDCVWGCEGLQGLCVSGSSVPQVVFDSSNRCVDEISSRDFEQSRYFQWPPHCVEGSFGADLDPFLHVPKETMTLQTSAARDRDSYSMFQATEGDSGRTMEKILSDYNIDRVFIMGLATDMVVKNTLWDILSSQNNTLKQSILVAAGVRGVFDEPGDYYLSSPQSGSGIVKAEAIARGASIVAATNVDEALGELCIGTCDSDSDCDGDMVCDTSAKPYGRCKPRPISNGIATAVTILSILGALIVFRKDIIESYNNRHKARGPPTDFVVLAETDIEGSSELWERMGELGKGDLMKNVIMKLHDECLRQSMKKHFGYELLVRGDAFLVAFHTVDDALSWALQVQMDLMNAPWPQECHNVTKGTMQEFGTFSGLRVRMGIHCGRVDKCIKHHGKIVYEGNVLKETTSVADAGVGGGILLSQATLPLSHIDIPYVLFDQGFHEMSAFSVPQRLKEVYPEELAGRANVRAALDTTRRLTPSFHDAPEGDVTMCYAHAVGLNELRKIFDVKIVEKGLSVMFETLREVMMRPHCRGYDCRGYEPNGDNMYVFSTYKQGLLFALEAQAALQQAIWPDELRERVGPTGVRGIPVRMGMHSGPLKRIRIPAEGLADYYGEAANRAARVMSVAVGGQVTCVEVELERMLQNEDKGLPDILVDHLGTFSLKGIPGVTSLVQVALTETLARQGGRQFTVSKKAQQVHPASAERRIHKAR
ncbi:adenylyl cyclase, CYR [Ostreococcus tauri]|uniref:Adenylyl cyclase, CYR n=1 Tax=Ostreococcus tauri TaxID=70448 RepID=A0A1Y5I3B5_OSTTA|nr:adenylyl cyclase, CYR [Ostreococcus tauri]